MVRTPVDERVERLTVRPDRGRAEDAVRAAVEFGRGERRDRTALGGRSPGRLDVVDRERDVVDAVAVGADVLGDLAVRGERRGQHEPDPVLDHDVGRPVADLGLETAEGDRREAPQRPVVGGRLPRVADPELDVVDPLQRQEVARLGIGVAVDPRPSLVRRSARSGTGGRVGHRKSLLATVRDCGRPV